MKLWFFFLPLLAAAPSSTNFTLQTYDFGSGSGTGSSSNFQLRGSAGSPAGNLTSSSYSLPAGVRASATAAVPPAPTFTNPSSYYDQLRVVLSVSGFPNDTKYLIAVSPDSFTTPYFVHPDHTISTSFSLSDYQTYAAWGASSGFLVLGLQPSTTYQMKVAALQGDGTGSAFGPIASAATVAPSVTLSLITSLTASPPFAVTLSGLTPGQVTDGDATVTATVTTNARQGGGFLLRDANAGLTSSSQAYTIPSATADLTSANLGYGARITSTSQSSGGPMVATSPYNGSGDNVGALTAALQPLASFANPVTSGSLTLALKAKTDITVPAANDFADTLTLTLSLLF